MLLRARLTAGGSIGPVADVAAGIGPIAVGKLSLKILDMGSLIRRSPAPSSVLAGGAFYPNQARAAKAAMRPPS